MKGRGPVALILGVVMIGFGIGASVLIVKDVNDPSPVPTPTASSPFCTVAGEDTKGKKSFPSEPCLQIDKEKVYLATMRTSMGPVTLLLDPKLAPRSVNNFVFLARQGFFDNTVFHLVQNVVNDDPEKDHAIVQGGDPTGTGVGGPGYTFGEPPPPITRYIRGSVVMARRAAPNTNGSQFFIVVRDWEELEPQYTFMGIVANEESMAILDEMVTARGSAARGGDGIAPEPPIRLFAVTIEEKDRS